MFFYDEVNANPFNSAGPERCPTGKLIETLQRWFLEPENLAFEVRTVTFMVLDVLFSQLDLEIFLIYIDRSYYF